MRTDEEDAPVRVLHVDDAAEFADLTASFLKRENDRFRVETATSAREGLARLDAEEFDCVVSDYDMPERSGIDFLTDVRGAYPALPFILFTGKGSEEVASDAISAGVTDYLQKTSGTEQYELLAKRVENAVSQYRATQRADETERLLLELTEASTDALWMFTHDMDELLYVNSAYENLWGRSTESLRSSPSDFLNGVVPEDRGRVRAAMETLSGGDPADVEYRLLSEEGDPRWVRSRGEPVRDDAGELVRVAGFTRDVTESKRKERQREAVVESFRSLYDVTTDADLSFEEKITRMLRLGCEQFGVQIGYLTRLDVDENAESGTQTIVEAYGSHELLQPGESCPLSQAYCRKTIETDGLLAVADAVESGWRGDPAYQRFDLGCYIGGKVVVDDDLYGTLCFASKTERDEPFTDYERMFVRVMSKWTSYELERKQTTLELEQKNDRLEEFATVVSHDLRNPLNVAQGQLELAREKCENDALAAVERAHDRMRALVDDILTLARAGNRVTDLQPVSLPDAVERCWQSVETADATLVTEAARTVRADAGQLHRLLENLIRNAVEHGGEEVTVTVRDVDGGFRVEDTGPGIPPDDRENAFDAGYSTSSKGTGFGLSIVERIVDAHGWSIQATDGDDGGACFDILDVAFADQ